MKARFLWVSLFLLPGCMARAPSLPEPTLEGEIARPLPLMVRAEQVVPLFSATADNPDELFAPEFLAKLPPAQLTQMLSGLALQVGPCVGVEPVKLQAHRGRFELRFQKGHVAPLDLVLEEVPPHRIAGMWIGPPVAPAANLEAVLEELRALPGQVSFLAIPLGDDEAAPLAALEPERPLAIGSAFKLWILAELVRGVEAGERDWGDVVALQQRSLPSGILQEWPQGSPLTLHSLATLMISRSDNTATDQLLHTLGRERVEAMMERTGHGHADRNRPFLSTAELFHLKKEAAAAERYVALTEVGEKRRFLEGLEGAPDPEDFGEWTQPRGIEELEWFASSTDLARLFAWFHERHSAAGRIAREVLAVNPGLPGARQHFSYVGFKGGSEPGVMNLSFLVEQSDGKAYAVVATWNNPDAPLAETHFLSLMERALGLVSKQ